MVKRFLFAFLIAIHGVSLAQSTVQSSVSPGPGQSVANASSVDRLPRQLHPLFERPEGGSEENEARLTRDLAAKFALLQASVGAATGGNKRGTHAAGFCLDGKLEIYDQSESNSWLQIGPFKKVKKGDERPLVRIRFADASSKPQSNWVSDVRAVSFSFEVDGQRQDFSMNNDPVFAFGNLTDFNNFMSFVLFTAALPSDKAIARSEAIANFFNANRDVAMSVGKAKALGDAQQGKAVYAYHTENYYSGSSFSFGKDRAAKFNLVRCGGLPPLREKLPADATDRTLIDRTVNAVNGVAVEDPADDKRNEVCFELEVEILDAKSMKVPPGWTGTQPPSAVDWVEDATLNWTEAGARSYKLGKLTAIPNSIKSPAESENDPGFDVNVNSWDEFKPLGNINRARIVAEYQSRRLRSPLVSKPAAAPATFSHTKAIDQGWGAEAREFFWYTPQGSYIIPYNWFMALEDPETQKPLHENLERFGFIQHEYEGESALNPDKLPIGMTKESPPENDFDHLRGKGDWLGITCAACHVGAVTFKDTRYIIDGGPSSLDLEKFSLAIEKSLNALEHESEFRKFQDSPTMQGVAVSQKDVSDVRQKLADRNTRSFFHGLDRTANRTVNAGPGRTDAFGIILNEVTSRALTEKRNATVATAPVSFPQLWGAPYEEWIQYSGLSNNAFTRNTGQVLGVFGDVILDPKSPGFLATTARFANLQELEEKLRDLKSPKWEQVFGAFSDAEKEQIKRGASIYSRTCMNCHSRDPKVVKMVPALEFGTDLKRSSSFVGTDPLYFANLKKSWSQVDTGMLKQTSVLKALGGKDSELAAMFGSVLSTSKPFAEKDNAVVLLAEVTQGIFLKYMKDNGISMNPSDRKYRFLTGGALPAKQTLVGAFKARSLDGIAFTGPYFHNGSVRTLRGVLSPEEREPDFYIGGTGYDQKNGGFENGGSYLFRANKLGNLNIGHDFGAHLSAEDKEDLLMYLKSL